MIYFTSLTVTIIVTVSSLALHNVMGQSTPSLSQLLENDPNISIFYSAIIATGLNITANEPITIFAPTNAAFGKVDSETLSRILQPGWGAHLQNVLTMHIVNAETFSDAIMDGDVLIAANEEEISVDFIGENVTLSSPNTNNSVITTVDIASSDGVLHQIDTVLLPQFVSVDILGFVGNLPDFSTLTELLQLTGLGTALTPDVVATIFAPTDEAFMALGDNALEFFRSDLASTTTLLTAHVLTPLILPTQDMVTGLLSNKTVGGTELYINVEETQNGTIYMVNNATITQSVLANNGIVHAIGVVFSIPTLSAPVQNLSSFAEILVSDPNLSILYSAIVSAGLNTTFDEPSTIFAPTNAAFRKNDSETISRILQPGWGAHLQYLLAMHIVNTETFSNAIMDGDVLTAANEEEIRIEVIGDNVTLSSPNTNNSVITAVDLGSSDGVMHQIDTVLLPQFVSNDLLSLAGNLPDFSILTELLKLTGLEMSVTPDIVATVFAPTDDAFMALGNETLAFYRSDTVATTTLLTAHVLTPLILPTQDMVTGLISNKTVGGAELYINVEETQNGTIYMVNNATITQSVLANNGIVHAISAVFSIPGFEIPSTTAPNPTIVPTTAPTTKMPVLMPPPPNPPTTSNPTMSASDATLYGVTFSVTSSLFVYFSIA